MMEDSTPGGRVGLAHRIDPAQQLPETSAPGGTPPGVPDAPFMTMTAPRGPQESPQQDPDWPVGLSS